MNERHPLSPTVIISGVIITVLGGILVALLVGEGRFANNTPATQPIQAVIPAPPTQVVQQVTVIVVATPAPATPLPPTPTPECFRTTELGPWATVGNVLIDAREPPGWVQADFWSPNRILKEGYDEVSVIFEPSLKIEVVGVAGDGWKYSSDWTKQDVENCTVKHITDSGEIRHKKLILISVAELCAIVECR
jgi:hypothetical protein